MEQGPHGRLKMKSMRNTATKKAYLNFLKKISCCRCGYIMHVSVYENCRIQSTSIWYKNHQDILNITKSYDRLHPDTVAQNSTEIPVGAQGFVGSPPYPGCIVNYYHQMCPALNSKPYWSNKQVVVLMLPRKPSSNMWGSNLLPTQFSGQIHAQNLPGKKLLQHFVA